MRKAISQEHLVEVPRVSVKELTTEVPATQLQLVQQPVDKPIVECRQVGRKAKICPKGPKSTHKSTHKKAQSTKKMSYGSAQKE